MPSARRPLTLVVVLLIVAAGIGRPSVVQADPPDPPAHAFPAHPASSRTAPNAVATPPAEYGDLWNLRRIGLPCDGRPDLPMSEDELPEDATVPADSAGAVVAIIDTGVDPTHPLLAGRLVPGYDIVNDDPDPSDDQGHGTHMAGIVLMVAPHVKIMPVKALSANGSGAHTWIATGIRWAADHGADVINMSLGGPYTSATMRSAAEYAWSQGVVLVAAAGSGNTSNPTYPAAYPFVMAVAATTADDVRASFSNYGTWISVAAPGMSILSSVRGGAYQIWSGTGMAAPHVAGLAGLVKWRYPYLTALQIREAIENGADDLGAPGFDSLFGYGRINACRTLDLAARTLPPQGSRPVPPWLTPSPPTD